MWVPSLFGIYFVLFRVSYFSYALPKLIVRTSISRANLFRISGDADTIFPYLVDHFPSCSCISLESNVVPYFVSLVFLGLTRYFASMSGKVGTYSIFYTDDYRFQV